MRAMLLVLSIGGMLVAQSPGSNPSVPGARSIIDSMLSQDPAAVMTPKEGKLAEANLTRAFSLYANRVPGSVKLLARNHPIALPAAPVSTCSVPLLKMHIPSDVQFSMQTVEPSEDKVDHMQVIVPAPACPDPSR